MLARHVGQDHLQQPGSRPFQAEKAICDTARKQRFGGASETHVGGFGCASRTALS